MADDNESGPPVQMHVMYRSSGGENNKSRPTYYSKLLALTSFLRSVESAGVNVDVVYWNDGPIPGPQLELMQASGSLHRVRAGSNRGSYVRAIKYASKQGWDPADLVWFAEDDYLYDRTAIRSILEAARGLPDIEYFGLYGSVRLQPALDRTPRREPRAKAPPVLQVPSEDRPADWFCATATTSTFGVRVSTLLEDARLLRVCPYTGGSWDTTSCLTYQGIAPFAWKRLGADLAMAPALNRLQVKAGLLVPIKIAVNLRALLRRPSRRRTLALTEPALATHMEEAYLAQGTDWGAVVRETKQWSLARKLSVEQ